MQTLELPIGPEQLKAFDRVLEEYRSGLDPTRRRIIASENWWKMRNTMEERKAGSLGQDGWTSRSGWLHNVIVSKHADAMESFPEPNILPREEGDREQARMLSAIIPCVLEQNHFEQAYSDAMWQKCKTGTGVYKVLWDAGKLNGLGDIGIERVNLLDLYWEPGVSDIQKSRYLFHTELQDKELLWERYPELQGKLKGDTARGTHFLYDDTVKTDGKAAVVEVYYHRHGVLQYCRYVEDTVLFATENLPEMAQRGLYDHGKYPYVFDALYPIEGSPCGYGYVDVCKNPQTEIDLLKTACVRNAQVGAVPRYFSRLDGSVNEEEFLDLSRPIVHVAGNLGEDSLRQIPHTSLDGNYMSLVEMTVKELRETSGNTETATGSAGSGITAASAIAALQEASGKGSRDAAKTSYRAFYQIVELCIELIRQFYDLPRQFRITGELGQDRFVTYTTAGLRPQPQSLMPDRDMGCRLPVFDIKISAQRKTVYTKVSQNELALQFFQLGFFNPQMSDMALLCLEMMDFDGKEEIIQKVAKNSASMELLTLCLPLAMENAAMTGNVEAIRRIQAGMQRMGAGTASGKSAPAAALSQADPLTGTSKQEHRVVKNAREQAAQAVQPEGGRVIQKGEAEQ